MSCYTSDPPTPRAPARAFRETAPAARSWVSRVFALVLCALGALAPSKAGGAVPNVDEHPPRDVAVVVQPSAARLSPLPADFERIEAGWLILESPASVHDRIELLRREANAFRTRLASDMAQPLLDRLVVRVARSPDQMAQLAPANAPPPEYASAVAYPSEHLVLLSLKAPYTWEATDLNELLKHELTHIALSDAVAGHDVPRWFNEGLAIHESGEKPWDRLQTLWEASIAKRLIPLDELDQNVPNERADVGVAYAESADVVRFLMREPDRARFGSLVQRVRGGAAFDRALEDAYDTDVRKLEYEWRQEVQHRFSIVPLLTGGGLLWVGIVGLAVAAWARGRVRARAKLAAWAREEAESQAALLASRAGSSSRATENLGSPGDMPAPIRSVPLVEHEGRWYTLH